MAINNQGKVFERNFGDSSKKDGFFTYRIKDTDLSFNGNSVSSFTHTNLCDYFIFANVVNGLGNLFCIECKSTKYSSMSIETEPEKNENKMIKAHQLEGLIEVSLNDGMYGGFVLNFRDEEKNTEETYYMSAKDMSIFLDETHKKSINKLDCKLRGIKINQKLKRKYYDYDIKTLIEDIVKKGD